MAYREQQASGLCKICREPSTSGCPRCGDPLCSKHMPAADQRCQSCENMWLEKSSSRELGRWGFASTSLVTIAKWSAMSGGLGIVLGIMLAFFPASEILLLPWIPVALLLLGFPLALAAVCALPFVRAAERGVDLMMGDERRKFLEESEDGHAAKLLSAPPDES